MTNKKRGLGKGLSALLADRPEIDSLMKDKDDKAVRKEGEIAYISLEEIRTKKINPEKTLKKML